MSSAPVFALAGLLILTFGGVLSSSIWKRDVSRKLPTLSVALTITIPVASFSLGMTILNSSALAVGVPFTSARSVPPILETETDPIPVAFESATLPVSFAFKRTTTSALPFTIFLSTSLPATLSTSTRTVSAGTSVSTYG